MEQKRDIETLEDIQLMVDSFYTKIREDELLGNIFNQVIQDKWQIHLEKMYRFWQTVLLDEHTYYGAPFLPHAKMPIDKIHFDRWLHIFYTTVDTLFIGEKAERAKWQGERMASLFLSKITYYRDNNITPLV